MVNKTNVFTLCLFLISACCVSQNTFVPDDNFEQALIDLGWDVGPLDDFVPTANINSRTDLDITSKNITDLTGIEDFIGLTNLDCSDNQLTVLNITQNVNLVELYCSGNQLTNLDVTNLPNLVRLWCFSNQLSNLNVSQNSGLISLRCEDNQLTNLDTSNNLNLNVLVCEQNQITTIDISNNTGLNRFQCGNNLLTNLDVSVNSNLSYLSCEQNQITDLNLTNNSRLAVLICFNNELTALDLSQNSNLTNLECESNMLCSLNLKNGNNNNVVLMDFGFNPDLNCVVVDDPNGDHSIWEPAFFSNYVSSDNDCDFFVPVDSLNDFIGMSYVLPTLNNGNYFTQSGGTGISLNPGDVISISQTIYIYNTTICNSNESSFNVLITNTGYYIPKYFTPNSDGNHDVWNVIDDKSTVNNITIYDKYGKLLKFLLPNSLGWDGTFNGEKMLSDDYWYVIILNTGEALKGHFALKR